MAEPNVSARISSPISGFINVGADNNFYVSVGGTWLQYISGNTVLTAEWTVDNFATYYSAEFFNGVLPGNTGIKTGVLPANTLPNSDNIKWRVRVQFLYGSTPYNYVGDTSGVLTTTDTSAVAAPASPKSVYIYGEEPNAFAWTHSISTGTDATRSDLQYSTNGSSWTGLATVTGNTLTTTIPANTFSAGRLYWRVRTYNSNAVAGAWSSAAECYVLAPVSAPTVSGITAETARPTFAWTAATQNAFELDVLQSGVAIIKSGIVISTSKSYKLTEFLADGNYTARLRVYDGNGNYSEWATYDFTVTTVKPDPPAITASQSGNDVSLSIANALEENDCYILRDGEPISKLNNPEINYAQHVQADGSWSVSDSAGGLVKDAIISGNSSLGGTPASPVTPLPLKAGARLPIVGENLFDGVSVLNSYITLSGITANDTKYRLVYSRCLPNTTYTISKTAGQRFATAYTTQLPAVGVPTYDFWGGASTASSKTFTTGPDAKYLVAWVYNSQYDTALTAEQMLASVQIEKGSIATPYEAYANPSTPTTAVDMWPWDNQNILTGDVTARSVVIPNYNGEPITGEYVSSTGGLDIGAYVVYDSGIETVTHHTAQAVTLPVGTVNMLVESVNGVLPSKADIAYRVPPLPRTYIDQKTAISHVYTARVVSPEDTYADSLQVSAAPTMKGYVLSNSVGTVNLKFRTSVTDDFSNIGSSSHYTGGEYPDFEFSEFSDNSFNLGFTIPQRHPNDIVLLEAIVKAKETVFVKSNYGDEMHCAITGYSRNPTKHQNEMTISLTRVNYSEVITYD